MGRCCAYLTLLAILLAPNSVRSEPLDDLQLDALMKLVDLRIKNADTRHPAAYQHLEELYARGEAQRNRQFPVEAAELFRTVILDGTWLEPAAVKDEKEPPPLSTGTPPLPPPPDVEADEHRPLREQKENDESTSPPDSEPPAAETPRSPWLIGGVSIYTAPRRESLRLVAGKLGVNVRTLATINGLSSKAVLAPGDEIRYNNLKIIPKRISNGVVINIPDKTLYYFKKGSLAKSIPIAAGKPTRKKEDRSLPWQTPTGKFKITAKMKNPAWRVPPSIQAEMAERKQKVQELVPPGKDNPLGDYAIRTSLAGILLHSTNMPASIYGFSSHGCIRLSPAEMEGLFRELRVNTPGEIIYEPVKVAVTPNQRVFLEIHPDVYGKVRDLEKAAKQLITRHNAESLVDWQKVLIALKKKGGVAEDVTLTPENAARDTDTDRSGATRS